MVISAGRLDLVPMNADFLRASLAGDLSAAEEVLGAGIVAPWPLIPDILEMRLRQLEKDPALEPWLLRAMVDRRTATMVGLIGFHTRPGPEYLKCYAPEAVEFGFEVSREFQRRGFAREAAKALMEWAVREHGVRDFILSIRPGNVASQALAAGLGFARVGSHVDEMDGEEDVFFKDARAAPGSSVA